MTEYVAEHPAQVTIDLDEKKPINVLHVDDESCFLKTAKQCLETQGRFQVDTVLSVENAVKALKKRKYDAVVSDYQMPEKDGLEFLKELRDSGNEIPFIIFTGKGREEVAIRALNLGADQYINKSGDPEAVYGELAHGIRKAVERRNAAKMLKESEEKYRNLVENFEESIIVADLKGNVLFANKATENLTGYTDRRTRMNVRRVTPLKYWPRSLVMLRKAKKGEQIPYFESMIRRKDGSLIPVESGGQAVFKDGKVVGIQIITRDISERLKAQDALRENESRFRNLFEAVPEAIYTISAEDGTITSLNPAFEKITGWKRSNWIGKSFEGLIHPDDLPLAMETFRKTIRGEALVPYELRVVSSSGEYLMGEFMSRPQVEKGRIVGELGIVRDITERKKAEMSLKESEEKFRNLAEQSPNMIFINKKGGIVYANKKAEETMGYTRKEFCSPDFNFMVLIAPESRELIESNFAKHTNGKDMQPYEYKLVTREGRKIDAILTSKLITYEGELAILGIVTEVTDKKETERAIQEGKQKFEGLFMGNPEAAAYLGPDFRVLNVNPRFEELFGYSLAEVKGKRINDVVVPKDKMEEGEMLDERALEGYVNYDTVRKRRDGTLIQVSVSAAPIADEGRIIGCMAVYRDITERKRYEERLSALHIHSWKLNLAESMEEIYRLTMDAVEKTLGFEIAFFMIADKGMLRVVDHRGYPASFSVELPLNGTKGGVSVEVVKTGKSINVPDVEKEDAWVEFMPGIHSGLDVPVKIGHRVLGVIGVDSRQLNAFSEKDQELLEILAAHAATAASNLEYARTLEMHARETKESQEKFRRLFMDNPEAAVYMDSGFLILDINSRFRELFGFSLEEVRGKHIDDVVVPRDKMEEAKMLAEEFMKGPVYYDTVRQRKDGTLVPVSISGAPIIVEDQLIGTVGLYKDISQLKKTEKAIRESQQKFERLFIDNPEAAVHLDSGFHILDANPRFIRLFGYSLDEIRGKHINDVIVPKNKMEEAVVFDERARKGKIYHEDTVRKRKDGSFVPVAFSAAPIVVENQVMGHIAVYKDISQLKEAEEELREALGKLGRMNEKLRVVGGLTRHDARNKLTAIAGNVYLAKKQLASGNEILGNLEEMNASVEQIVRIFDFAKTYEMLGVEEMRFVDVEKAVNDAVSLFSDLGAVKVINNCSGLTVLADSLLRQLFYNLVDNSLKYGEKTRAITVHYEETDEDKLELVCEDDGVGIAEVEKKKLFQEGYGKGTGYGLYLIRRICEGYGWSIQETGKEGEGAQFTIVIPRIGEKGKANYNVNPPMIT